MKKTKKVITEVVERYCDECGKSASHQCHFCFKDLCGWMANKCAVKDDRGDEEYPDYYCKKCWDIGKKFRDKISKLQEKEWKLEEEWEKEAKNGKTNKK